MIDEYQKMGLGMLLLNLIALAAIERGITRLSFTYLPQNEGIVRLIQKMGIPVPGPHSKDYVQMFIDVAQKDAQKFKDKITIFKF
jgi:GNAT superfamily N-acetyltransferase